MFGNSMSDPTPMTLETFQRLTEEALLTLPDEIKTMMENVTVTVAEYPSPAGS